MAKLTVGSLFAGIGGFDLGLERAGFEIRWQVEIDPFCRKVLEKHWPAVRRYEDVRTVGSELEWVNVICGGFPCQDVSEIGPRLGLTGERSGLWREFSRLIGDLRPDYVVVENVSGLLDRGFGEVLGDLAAVRYDAEWEVVSACATGAPHTRERVWIVAYPEGSGLSSGRVFGRPQASSAQPHDSRAVSFPPRPDQSGICGVVDGVSDRSHRIRALGNAIVPQIAEWIGRRILEAEAERLSA